ncbi:MAG TPA: hydroxyacylglutathione hydrolase [Gammaproteobacteria bacterium]|nr:hydroxyacylglutathione hydrolase [Gammaproteobacteria bacterium]
MSGVEVHMFPCLKDNYGFLLHDRASGVTAAIDTPEVEPIVRELDAKGWTLTYILNTHHHGDHAGGNLRLKALTGCRIVGPKADAARIPGIDIEVGEGDAFDFGGHAIEVFDTPGHTRGHIVYLLRDERIGFVGDTLFAMGCGRLFEGTPDQMWTSLRKILSWPDDTRLYCAHEYTQANARFALTVEPGNRALVERAAEVDGLRARNRPTVPTTLALEKATNPFLRPSSAHLRETVGLPAASDVDVFARTRALKDAF